MKEQVNDKILVTNIQRFSLHDGPGIRTTIFLKGCSLHCPWCANPENISFKIEPYKKDGLDLTIGQYISCDELYEIVIRDKVFYENGGITFSGGEPLMQIELLKPLLERLKKDGIHLCVETALFISQKKLDEAMKYFDMFYVDIKILDEEKCREVLGGDINLYKRNLQIILEKNIDIRIRMPIISKYTFSEENFNNVISYLKQKNIDKIELICEHHLGNSKYVSLGRDIPQIIGITKEDMDYSRAFFEQKGISVEICSI